MKIPKRKRSISKQRQRNQWMLVVTNVSLLLDWRIRPWGGHRAKHGKISYNLTEILVRHEEYQWLHLQVLITYFIRLFKQRCCVEGFGTHTRPLSEIYQGKEKIEKALNVKMVRKILLRRTLPGELTCERPHQQSHPAWILRKREG